MYAQVIVDVPVSEVDYEFTYIVPKELEQCIHVGSRVFVEFGMQKTLGYVIELTNEPMYTLNLKEIIEVVDFENGLTDEQIKLAKNLATTLITPLTNTLNLMYPSFMKTKLVKSIKVLNYDLLNAEVAQLLGGNKTILVTNKILSKYNLIKKEIEKGNLELVTSIYTYGKSKLEKYYYVVNNLYSPKTEKRKMVLEYLSKVGEATIDEIIENTGASEYLVKDLENSGYIAYRELLPKKEVTKKTLSYYVTKSMDLEIAKNKFNKVEGKPYLLYTNNNKFRDDFLIEVIKETVEDSKRVLILTPTILENTRITKLFKSALDLRIVTFSSKITNNDYYYNYHQILDGNVDVVITTKSGAFLPLDNIGLIVAIDSESNYYINEQSPKFHTIEVLKQRSSYHNAKLILTSSAPSIVDFYEYFQNKYTIISKIEKKENDLELVNMKNEYLNNLLSQKLKHEIANTLRLNKIAVLLLNSLAYNQTVLCSKCNKLIVCPHCKVGLSYHKFKNIYQCSSCNYQTAKPICECGSTSYSHFGYGLELLKEVLLEEFKDAKIMQVDSDSFTSESDYQEFHVALEEKEVDIIIGTYPLASIYHDDIRLVGLINLDSLLQKNDYRSSEEAYSIISKLCMHKSAKIIIQGYNIDHYAVIDAINNNYEDFFTKELKQRKDFSYPPFNEISRLLITGEFNDMYYFANYFKRMCESRNTTSALGPVYVNKLKAVQLIIKFSDIEKITRLIEDVKNKFGDKKLIVSFERYPVSFN